MKRFFPFLIFLSSLAHAKSTEKKPTRTEIKQERIASAPTKNRVWSLELATLRYAQKVDPGVSMQGFGGKVSLGYGLISKHRLFLVDASFYLGPFESNFGTAQYDHAGTGAGVLFGHSFGNKPIRGKEMGLGLLGGLGYQTIGGRLYGRNDVDKAVPASPDGTVTRFSSTSSILDLNYGIFISWMKVQRTDSHEVESLTTRNEGILVSLQAAMPLWSRFRAKYNVLDSKGVESEKIQTGRLEGFKFILSLRAFLGT